MITEIVFFALPEGISRQELLEKYHKSAPTWMENPDLLHKTYVFDEANNRGGGVYLWKDLAAQQRWHGEDYRKMIRDVYGSEPEIRVLDTALIVDKEAGQIIEPPQG